MKNLKTFVFLTSVISSLSGSQKVTTKIDHKKIEKVALLLEESAHKGLESKELDALGKTLTAFELQQALRKKNSEGKTSAEIAFESSQSTCFCTLINSCDSFYDLYIKMEQAEEIATAFVDAKRGDIMLASMSPEQVLRGLKAIGYKT
jgi:hypothetical protein